MCAQSRALYSCLLEDTPTNGVRSRFSKRVGGCDQEFSQIDPASRGALTKRICVTHHRRPSSGVLAAIHAV
jgi:hypothetical protein